MLAALAVLLGAHHAVIAPYDHRIVYVGRFDTRDPYGPKGAWPGVEARIEVKGEGVATRILDTGPDWIQVEVDGQPTQAVQLMAGIQTIDVRAPKPGAHTYAFIKRTEASVGTTQFLGFEAETGKLLPARRRKHTIQVIGDDIACGYGNEGTDAHEAFRPATENAYMAYPSIASRDIGADLELIAYSGKKIWPDQTILSVFDLNIPSDVNSPFDYRQPPPDVIVIHVGANDFRKQNPDRAEWIAAYKGLLARLRRHYARSWIYCAFGGTTSDGDAPDRTPLSTLRDYLKTLATSLREAGDRRLSILEFEHQRPEDGIGAEGFPSIATHQKMAETLEAALRRDLRW